MQESILLAIVFTLVNAGEYFIGCYLAISACWRIFFLAIILQLVNAGEYFVHYCLAISECCRIFCWL